MSTILITGARKGIGLEFVRQLANDHSVIAVTRNTKNCDELQKLASANINVRHVQFDLCDFAGLPQILSQLDLPPIDILINNAGIYGDRSQTLDNFDPSNFIDVIKTNAAAQLNLTKLLLPKLQHGQEKLIVNITSKMASIADNTSGACLAYRASKAALNATMKSVAIDLNADGFKVLLLHPGWVQTDMGGPNALINAETSVQGMLQIINAHQQYPELFYDYQGNQLPW